MSGFKRFKLNRSPIKTTNLQLVARDSSHFEAILKDSHQLEEMLGVTLVESWLEFPKAMQLGCKQLKVNPDALRWWTYLFLHTKEKALIGNGGFKGSPDKNGDG